MRPQVLHVGLPGLARHVASQVTGSRFPQGYSESLRHELGARVHSDTTIARANTKPSTTANETNLIKLIDLTSNTYLSEDRRTVSTPIFGR